METSDFKIERNENGILYGKLFISVGFITRIFGYIIVILITLGLIFVGIKSRPETSSHASITDFGEEELFGTKVLITTVSAVADKEFIIGNVFDLNVKGNLYYDKNTRSLIFESVRNYFIAKNSMKLFFHYKKNNRRYILSSYIERKNFLSFNDREIAEYIVVDDPFL